MVTLMLMGILLALACLAAAGLIASAQNAAETSRSLDGLTTTASSDIQL
jgi:hypothetical protein